METFEELEKLRDELNKSVESLRVKGEELSKAEHDYKVALSYYSIDLKNRGYSASMIDKVVYGYKGVAALRMKRDTAQTLYDVNKEQINIIKLNIRIVMTQLQLDYGLAGQGGY